MTVLALHHRAELPVGADLFLAAFDRMQAAPAGSEAEAEARAEMRDLCDEMVLIADREHEGEPA